MGPNLNKDDCAPIEGNEVDFAETRTIIFGDNGVTLGTQELFGLTLSLLPKLASSLTNSHEGTVAERTWIDQGRSSSSVESLRALCHTDTRSARDMRINKDEVRRVALLARLALTPEEETDLVMHFDKVLTYMEKLNELHAEGVEPTAHAVEVPAPLREDRVTNQPDTDALLQNAPVREADFFKVPKIIE